MTDFTDLAATVAAKRAELLARDANERDRRSGLLALRPSIDLLETAVRPVLEAAKAALLPAGVQLEFEDGWTETSGKQASLFIHGRTAGSWPSTASLARSRSYEIAACNGALGLIRHSGALRGQAPETIALPADADVASEAVRLIVDDVLAKAEGQPMMRGDEVRGPGRPALVARG